MTVFNRGHTFAPKQIPLGRFRLIRQLIGLLTFWNNWRRPINPLLLPDTKYIRQATGQPDGNCWSLTEIDFRQVSLH
jgi:hypothetical protein